MLKLCKRENRHEQTVNFSENHEHFLKNVGSKQFRNIRQTVGTGRSRSECQHIIQSFAPGEVTPEWALLIGQELCKALFNDEYQYVLAVRVNHYLQNEQAAKRKKGQLE